MIWCTNKSFLDICILYSARTAIATLLTRATLLPFLRDEFVWGGWEGVGARRRDGAACVKGERGGAWGR